MEFNPIIAEKICERLAGGEFLRTMCREEGMPSWQSVYRWMDADPEFAGAIARARVSGFDALAEDSVLMLDEAPARCDTQFGDKVDPGHVQWLKNRAEQRLKLLAKWSPKKYGDKQEVTHKVEDATTERLLQGRTRTGG